MVAIIKSGTSTFSNVLVFCATQYDQDYHPGRRRRGKDYEEGMVGYVANFLYIYTYISEFIYANMITMNSIIFCSTSFHFIIQDRYL